MHRVFEIESENLLECWQGRLSHVQRADEVVITAVMIMVFSTNKTKRLRVSISLVNSLEIYCATKYYQGGK